MRINKFVVEGLFDRFKHVVTFRDGGITIIHGPNGFGKTTVLKIIRSLFPLNYFQLRRLHFKKIRITGTDGSILEVTRELQSLRDSANQQEIPNLSFEYRKGKTKHTCTVDPQKARKSLHFSTSMVERFVPFLTRIGPREWQNVETGDALSLDEVLENYGHHLPIESDEDHQIAPVWLRKYTNTLDVYFIQTQRLLTFKRRKHYRDPDELPSTVTAVVDYSDQLAASIREKLAQSATISQNLDRSYPSRLFKYTLPKGTTEDNLRNRYQEQLKLREDLKESGLLDEGQEAVDLPSRELDQTELKVLSLYIEDVDQKLAVFDDIQKRIDLLKDLINSRFQYKKLSIDKKAGFVFASDEGVIVNPADLSSGEQHEVVLNYELLFKVKQGSLILIDEPELSLHVAWQMMFLEDLIKIISINDFNFLIATHSPQIINERWELTEELSGKSK